VQDHAGGRHRQGTIYHVRVDLTAPGGEVVVNREPGEDHTHEDLHVAIRDAFDAARRADCRIACDVSIARRSCLSHSPLVGSQECSPNVTMHFWRPTKVSIALNYASARLQPTCCGEFSRFSG
jgi:hypothetical protein